MRFTCTTTCYWRETLWEPGQTVDIHGDEEVPEHFQADSPADSEGEGGGMTKTQIKEALDAKGVRYPSDANKATLQAILDANQ